MSKQKRPLKDRLEAAMLAPVSARVVKATDHALAPVKEKHLEAIRDYTFRGDINIGELVDALLVRAHEPDWVVSLKALVVTHATLRAGHERFAQYFATCASHFSLDSFDDARNPPMSSFVRRYAKTMNERLMGFRALGADPAGGSASEAFANLGTMAPTECFKPLKTILRLLDGVINCLMGTNGSSGPELNPRDVLTSNFIVNRASSLLLKDALLLYKISNDAICNIFGKFFTLPPASLPDGVGLGRRYVALCSRLDEAILVARAVGLMEKEIPSLAEAPSRVLPSLQEYADNYREHHAAAAAAGSLPPSSLPPSSYSLSQPPSSLPYPPPPPSSSSFPLSSLPPSSLPHPSPSSRKGAEGVRMEGVKLNDFVEDDYLDI